MAEGWSVDDVCGWLDEAGLTDATEAFTAQEIDGETMLDLTERMVEKLFPLMKHQVKFLRLRKGLISRTEMKLPTDDTPPPSPSVPDLSDDIATTMPSSPATPRRWPSKYTLPGFPPHVINALDKKDSIFKSKGKSKLRAQLVQVLLDDISKVTLYPNRKMYSDVLDALCTKYPFLKDASISGYETILDSLKNKFKKERKDLVSHEAVQQAKAKFGAVGRGRKRKGENNDAEFTKKSRQNNLHDEAMEDDHSLKKHQEMMKKEMEKMRPNSTLLSDLMERTSLKRARAMETMTTEEAMREFSYLQLPTLLLHEMQLRFGVNCQTALTSNLPKFAGQIFKKAATSKLATILKSKVDEEIEENTRLGMQRAASLLLLPGLFKEKEELLFICNKEPSAPTPVLKLLGSQSMSPIDYSNSVICMDGREIVRTDNMDLTDSVACLLAMYYVFGIAYPKGLKNTLGFLERYVFGIQTVEKTAIPVLRLYTVLDTM